MNVKSYVSRRDFLKISGTTVIGLTTSVSPWKTLASPSTSLHPWEIREKMANDPLRPLYHFLPPRNWMNDPNGLIHWEGQYHLFYQHNPDEAVWGNMHWGHAVSSDLVHWRDLPIALAPTPGGPDQNGCWSGCAVNDNGTPTILYTGAMYTVPIEQYRGGVDARQVVCLATSNDNLTTWQKYAHNPVIADPPSGIVKEGFRDPYVWREDDAWYLVLASGLDNRGPAVLLYRSFDLRDWEYLGPLFIGNIKYGTIFECPSFFTLGGKHVLVVGAQGKSRYFVGTYANHRFTAEKTGVLDAGFHYSPQVMVDEQGRRIVFGWSMEGDWSWSDRDNEALKAPEWAGVSPLPRVLSLAPDNTMLISPVPELAGLQGEHVHFSNMELQPGPDQTLPIEGNCLEILMEFDLGTAKGCGVKLCCSQDEKEKTIVAYDRRRRNLFVSCSSASRPKGATKQIQTAQLQLVEGETLKLHIFLDRSIMDVFANDRCCITSRLYPRPDSRGMKLFANGGRGWLKSLDIWQMKPIWPRSS